MDVRMAKEARLAELKAQLMSVEGSPTEVYSRIVGYYRSVRNWNAGKREEFGRRREYSFPSAGACAASFAGGEAVALAARGAGNGGAKPSQARRANGRPVSYLLFTRQNCPNCPPVRDYMAATTLDAHLVDVDSEQGLDLARSYEVMATPTVVLLDSSGEEVGRGYTRAQLMAVISPVSESVLA